MVAVHAEMNMTDDAGINTFGQAFPVSWHWCQRISARPCSYHRVRRQCPRGAEHRIDEDAGIAKLQHACRVSDLVKPQSDPFLLHSQPAADQAVRIGARYSLVYRVPGYVLSQRPTEVGEHIEPQPNHVAGGARRGTSATLYSEQMRSRLATPGILVRDDVLETSDKLVDARPCEGHRLDRGSVQLTAWADNEQARLAEDLGLVGFDGL